MNICAGTLPALFRAIFIALLTLCVAVPLRDFLGSLAARDRRIAWTVLLAPYLTPVVLVAYAYSALSLSLFTHPALNLALYMAMLVFKLAPVSTLILYFAPPSLSPEALHCHRLLSRRSFPATIAFRIRGAGRAPAIAFAVVFLFAFNEFETASLWGIRTWTVTLFDAQTGGMQIISSLHLAWFPIFCEAAVLLFTIVSLFRARLLPVSPPHRHSIPGMWKRVFSCVVLATGILFVTAAPLLMVFKHALAGFTTIAENFVLTKDILASLLFASGAACCSYFAAVSAFKRVLPACIFSIPGLMGALLLSLQVVALFQLPVLRTLYNTPLPLLIALTLLLFPYALLLRLLLRATEAGPSLHLAGMLGNRRLLWHLKTKRELWTAFFLFCCAYFDLTASSLAAPVGMTPVFVRLYNLMHYGQTSVLSAMVCAAFLAPVAVLLLATGAFTLRAFIHNPR